MVAVPTQTFREIEVTSPAEAICFARGPSTLVMKKAGTVTITGPLAIYLNTDE